uniref:CNOT1_CAF1_bind domain-containing protein n=1 Tax=Mesocestoides corti TaxID=53468 RepID=A0A5K3G3E7_MESCO
MQAHYGGSVFPPHRRLRHRRCPRQPPEVRPRVLFELVRSIKAILRSIRTDIDDAESRSALNNLGRFLGIFTLARNKPILFDDLNIK